MLLCFVFGAVAFVRSPRSPCISFLEYCRRAIGWGTTKREKKCWISRRNNCRQQRHDDHKHSFADFIYLPDRSRSHTPQCSQSADYTCINSECKKKNPFGMTERRADDNIQCAQHHTSCSSTTASTYFISLSVARASPGFDVHQTEKFATTVAVAEWKFAAHVYGIVSLLRTYARTTVRWNEVHF